MNCWECGKETKEELELEIPEWLLVDELDSNPNTQRRYCAECYQKITIERKRDRTEYIRLKKKLMFERAVRMLERQNIDLYDYKEAINAVKEYSEENPDKFDSAHEMVAAVIFVYNEIAVKLQYAVAGYRVDFYIPSIKATLEVDGVFHKHTQKRDSKRDIAIRGEMGADVEIVRIDTAYIEKNAELLVEAIKSIREERQRVRKKNGGLLPTWYKK